MIDFLMSQTSVSGFLMVLVLMLCCFYLILVGGDRHLNQDAKYKIFVIAGSFVVLELAHLIIGSLPNFMLIGSGILYFSLIIHSVQGRNAWHLLHS